MAKGSDADEEEEGFFQILKAALLPPYENGELVCIYSIRK